MSGVDDKADDVVLAVSQSSIIVRGFLNRVNPVMIN